MAKIFTGNVVSNKGDKTIVVSIETRKTHSIYKKQFTISNKLMVHDENNEASEGDRVQISETRPKSKMKKFTLDKIITKAVVKHEEKEESQL
jgi:small subunit ribosomal protein S17